jgi:ABC-type transporter Mla MlaB component
MLRITRQSEADRDTLLLEGKLLKEWIEELQEALAQTRRDAAAIALDLSGLSFIDDEGARFLSECRRRGVSLLRASPFVTALLYPPVRRRRRPRS